MAIRDVRILMEGYVGRIEGRAVVRCDRGFRLLQIGLEYVLVGPGHPTRSLGGNLALESAANEEPLPDVVKRYSRDKRAVLRRDVDELVVGKPAHRSRHRITRNSESLAKLGLFDQTARFERSGQDRVLQVAVNGVRLRMGPFANVLPATGGKPLTRPFPTSMPEASQPSPSRQYGPEDADEAASGPRLGP